jgi:hypothetical protein
MTYSDQTPFYGIPVVKTGDQINAVDEKQVFQIIENLLKAGVLGAGTTRVFKEGTYVTTIGASNSVTVSLTGNPAIRGIANYLLVESSSQQAWFGLAANNFYYLYIQPNANTKFDATQFNTVSSTTPLDSSSSLLMATLDNTVPGAPVLNTAPAGKPIGGNLFDLLNSPVNPFGSSLTQSNIHALTSMDMTLSSVYSFVINQLNAAASVPVIKINNSGSGSEIQSTGELRLGDSRVSGNVALSDSSYYSLPRGSSSILGSLNVLSDVRLKRAVVSGSATSSYQTIIGVNDTSSPWTITLATSAMVDGRIYIIKDESGAAGTNAITVTAQVPGTNKIDGASSKTINTNYGVLRLYSSSDNWFTF